MSLIVDLNELKYQEHLKTSKIETVKNNEPIIDLKDQINIFKSTKNIEDIYLKNLEKINPKNFTL